MTLDERVHALAPLGLTPRQTRFLVTVALHSGYCLRRQYAAFAGVRYGKNVRHFLDGLVATGVASRTRFRADRGHVYHLHARPLYRAIGLERHPASGSTASPALDRAEAHAPRRRVERAGRDLVRHRTGQGLPVLAAVQRA